MDKTPFDVRVELGGYACEYARRKGVGQAWEHMGIDTQYDLASVDETAFTRALQIDLDAGWMRRYSVQECRLGGGAALRCAKNCHGVV